MQKTVPTDKARQCSPGRPVFVVLIVGLLLAMGAWAGVEIWREYIDAPAEDDASGANPDAN